MQRHHLSRMVRWVAPSSPWAEKIQFFSPSVTQEMRTTCLAETKVGLPLTAKTRDTFCNTAAANLIRNSSIVSG
jgi:hypothetical protein